MMMGPMSYVRLAVTSAKPAPMQLNVLLAMPPSSESLPLLSVHA